MTWSIDIRGTRADGQQDIAAEDATVVAAARACVQAVKDGGQTVLSASVTTNVGQTDVKEGQDDG